MRRHPYKLYGAALLLVVAGLVTLSLLAFNQAFSTATYVTVHMQRAGLQLLPGSDVKVRGLIVGSVQSITSNGTGADIKMRLQPSQARALPQNVTVRMLPKTLFGEKYVDLLLPAQPDAQHLHNGSVIAQDQTRPTLEIDQALNDLLPVLRTVSPVELNQTLTALATAVSGRGAELGQTIDQLDRYVTAFDPHLPQLHHDLDALATVSKNYASVADPLLRIMSNLTVTSDTVVNEKTQLTTFLHDVTGAADNTRDLLARSGSGLIDLNRVARPVAGLLARYSPEFPCFIKGYAKLVPRIHNAVPRTPGLNHAAHVVVEFVPSFPTYQYPIDLPQFGDKRGPSCYGLPNPPLSLPVIRYKDGTQDDPRFDAQGGSPGHAAGNSAPGSSGAGTRRVGNITDLLQAPLAPLPGGG